MSRGLITIALILAVAGCSPGGGMGKGTPRAVEKEEKALPPCHPGCFPAGTVVETPDGPRRVEDVRAGDSVILVGPDGTARVGAVRDTFCTSNRLVEVRTDAGTLTTTTTQPLCLRDGGFRTAGDLSAGDVVWRWQGGERRPARVLGVRDTGREEAVFNLVVGESAVFVAGGFLARGKPPAE